MSSADDVDAALGRAEMRIKVARGFRYEPDGRQFAYDNILWAYLILEELLATTYAAEEKKRKSK